MSAYIPDKAHIDALVDVALHGPTGGTVSPDSAWHSEDFRWFTIPSVRGMRLSDIQKVTRHAGFDNMDDIGQMLTDEVVNSVSYRYGDAEALPGNLSQWWVDPYKFTYWFKRPARLLSPIEALAAIDGYEYQACEHPGWDVSEAKQFCDALRLKVIGQLPGYHDTDAWHIRDVAPAPASKPTTLRDETLVPDVDESARFTSFSLQHALVGAYTTTERQGIAAQQRRTAQQAAGQAALDISDEPRQAGLI